MTDKEWICLACLLVAIVLVSGLTVAMLKIADTLTRIARGLGWCEERLRDINDLQRQTANAVSSESKILYEAMFKNAEITIHRNGMEEN